MYCNGICKEFFPIFIELSDHFLRILVLPIALAAHKPSAELIYAVFDRLDINLVSLVIESIPTG